MTLKELGNRTSHSPYSSVIVACGENATENTSPPCSILKASNVASQPKYSPLRYPGGKTWLIPQIRSWLNNDPTSVLVEPFAGGGTASLVAVLEGYVERALLIERDPCVAAVWNTILSNDAEWLVEAILNFKFTIGNVRQILRTQARNTRFLAFQTVVKNRARRGGILADSANLIRKGERGRGIKSRWYPDTIALRIALIYTHRKQFTFLHGDGIQAISKFSNLRNTVRFFVDPPYPEMDCRRGNRLYTYNKLDHEKLFALLDSTNGDFLLTYNDSPQVRALTAKHKFALTLINMRGTHGLPRYEMLIRPVRQPR